MYVEHEQAAREMWQCVVKSATIAKHMGDSQEQLAGVPGMMAQLDAVSEFSGPAFLGCPVALNGPGLRRVLGAQREV